MSFHFFAKMNLAQTIYFSISNFLYKLTQPNSHVLKIMLSGEPCPVFFTSRFCLVNTIYGTYYVLYLSLDSILNLFIFGNPVSPSALLLYNGYNGFANNFYFTQVFGFYVRNIQTAVLYEYTYAVQRAG